MCSMLVHVIRALSLCVVVIDCDWCVHPCCCYLFSILCCICSRALIMRFLLFLVSGCACSVCSRLCIMCVFSVSPMCVLHNIPLFLRSCHVFMLLWSGCPVSVALHMFLECLYCVSRAYYYVCSPRVSRVCVIVRSPLVDYVMHVCSDYYHVFPLFIAYRSPVVVCCTPPQPQLLSSVHNVVVVCLWICVE